MQVDRREARIGERQPLGLALDQPRPGPAGQRTLRLGEVGAAEVEADDRQARVVVLDRAKEPARAAGDIQKRLVGETAAFQMPGERHQGLTAHRVGGAVEQHLDLKIVQLGRVLAQIAVGLIVEIAQVVGGIAPARRGLRRPRDGRAGGGAGRPGRDPTRKRWLARQAARGSGARSSGRR